MKSDVEIKAEKIPELRSSSSHLAAWTLCQPMLRSIIFKGGGAITLEEKTIIYVSICICLVLCCLSPLLRFMSF